MAATHSELSMDEFCDFIQRFIRQQQGFPAKLDASGNRYFAYDAVTITSLSMQVAVNDDRTVVMWIEKS